MGKEHLKQLKDRDPAKRRAAINILARDLNRDALKPLAVMVKDDPEEEIRQLARRAGVYIMEKLGDRPSTEASTAKSSSAVSVSTKPDAKSDPKGKKEKPPTIEVSEDDARRARGILDTAASYQGSGEKAKAIKYLSQALKVDPNLRYDPYFINVAQVVTDLDGDAAIQQLGNVTVQKEYIEKESRQKLQKEVDEHNATVQKTNWVDAGVDFGLMAMVLLIGITMVLFLNTEFAKTYATKIQTNRDQVASAEAEGRIVDPAADPIVYISTEKDASNQPIKFTELIPDPQLLTLANSLKALTLADILPSSLFITVVVIVGVFISMGAIHLLANVLRGNGRFPHLAHRFGSTLVSRMVTGFILAGVASLIIYEVNGGTFLMIIGGIFALFGLFTVFKLIGVISKAYHLDFMMGIIATLPFLAICGAGVAAAIVL